VHPFDILHVWNATGAGRGAGAESIGEQVGWVLCAEQLLCIEGRKCVKHFKQFINGIKGIQ
jgi:hypothetical protein